MLRDFLKQEYNINLENYSTFISVTSLINVDLDIKYGK